MMRWLTRPKVAPRDAQQVASLPYGTYGTQDTYRPYEERPMPNIQDLLREEGIQVGEQVRVPQNLGQRYNIGGLVRSEFNKGSKKSFGFGRENWRTEKVTLGDKNYRYWLKKLYDEDADYSRIIEIDASSLKPSATFGYKPDQVRYLADFETSKVDQIYIGSCTNGRLSDLREAAEVTKGKKLAFGVRGIVSPATPKIFREAMKEGLIDIFMDAGYLVSNPTCGACLGMSNGVLAPDEVAATTTNRNFNGRMGKGGMVHLMSPSSAAACGITGYLTDPNKI